MDPNPTNMSSILTRSRSFVDFETTSRMLFEGETNEEDIKDFEQRFSSYIGSFRCIALNQARAGLLMGLKAIGVQPNEEVIVQSFTYEGVLNAILDSGAVPVLADSSLNDYNANLEIIEREISPRTKVIIGTHLFGIPCDIREIAQLASDHSCYLIEDCAQGLGARYEGKKVGSYGDIAIVSFNFEKHLSTGQGGMLVLNNRELDNAVSEVADSYTQVSLREEKCYSYGLLVQDIVCSRENYSTTLPATFGEECCRKDPKFFQMMDQAIQQHEERPDLQDKILPYLQQNHIRILPQKREHKVTDPVLESLAIVKDRILQPRHTPVEASHLLMGPLRAKLGTIGLSHLERINAIRNANAKLCQSELEGSTMCTLPVIEKTKDPAFLKFNVLISANRGSAIATSAWRQGFEIGNYQWPKPSHRKPPYTRLCRYRREALQNSEIISRDIINIPIHYDVKPDDIVQMAALISQKG